MRAESRTLMSSRQFQKQVAGRIKQRRLARGLLQKDLEKFGYSLRHYQKIESGELNLTLKTLFKISQALNTEVTDFIKGEEDSWAVYQSLFHAFPFGVIVWKLEDPQDPDSLSLFEHNKYGARAVYRDLANSKGKRMLEIFPKARSQDLIDIFYEVITTGKSKFVPEVIRHDKDFPLTVFSTQFVKCGPDLGAAIFTDITDAYLERQEAARQRAKLERLSRLPVGENEQVNNLKDEVNQLLRQLGRPQKY
jgi:transcriptional regulator with XRE-family HTH domain